MVGIMKKGMLIMSILAFLLCSASILFENPFSSAYLSNNDFELKIDVCSYIGGAEDDRSWSIAVDHEDNIYITGYTESNNFPLMNSFGEASNSTDIFVAKFAPSGGLVYSSRIGGSASDKPSSIEVDESGNAYVAGTTYSQDFPIVNACDPAIEPGNPPYTYGKDGFILKLNSSGNGITFSTYLGGDDSDSISDLAIDSENNTYVVGSTSSPDFPITQNAFDKSYEHYSEGFVTKLNGSDQSLIYSSFVGAEKNDRCDAIALDSSNNMYITGTTQSAEFHTKNAYSRAFSDDQFCCFVLKLTNAGSLDYSTHVGGTAAEFPDGDSASDIAVDSDGNAYVSGQTSSVDFPLVNEFVDTLATNQDGFIFKLSPSGRNLLYSSHIGGDYSTAASDLAVNDLGEVCLLGFTSSNDFEAIGGNSTYGGGMDDGVFYLLSANGTPVYSSYLGGNDSDTLGDVVLDSSDRFLIAGYTGSTDLPTQNAYDETFNGGSFDAFLLVLSTHAGSSTIPTFPIAITDITLVLGFVGIIAIVAFLIIRRKRSSIL
jgi:hypothetical protein